ncbi:MAG: hypothetical protein J6R47_00635 [Acholeplasmatales bacterium]|nr:hypothetical protein [Acholeplasmatales bacterium]
MEIIFYNIVSIITSVLVVIYSINLYKLKKIVYAIASNVLSVLLLATGIVGFIVPKEYEFIVIMAMLVLCILMVCIYVFSAKKKKDKCDK